MKPRPLHIRHGTRHAYDAHGCRCQACRDACSAHVRERRSRYIDSGRCPYCGGPPVPGVQPCADCKGTRDAARAR